MYDCHMEGDMFNPMAFLDISMMCCQNMGVYHSISWNFLIISENGMDLLNLELTKLHIWNFLTLRMCLSTRGMLSCSLLF